MQDQGFQVLFLIRLAADADECYQCRNEVCDDEPTPEQSGSRANEETGIILPEKANGNGVAQLCRVILSGWSFCIVRPT